MWLVVVAMPGGAEIEAGAIKLHRPGFFGFRTIDGMLQNLDRTFLEAYTSWHRGDGCYL